MNVFFDNKDLVSLYTEGTSKKYELPKNALNKFFKAIAILDAAQRIQDIWAAKSFHFKKLQGSLNRFAMRLNGKWRLEMRIDFTDTPPTTGTIYLEDITNHYE